MTKFEEELSNLPVSKSTNYTEYWNKAQLLTVFKDWQPQQALPVVPECMAEWIEILKTKGLKPLKNPETYGETGFTEEKLQNIVFWISEHQEDYMRAWLDGYTVEKPQLFEVKMPIVYWDDDASQLTNGFDFLRIDKETDEVDFVGFLSNTKKHTVHFTEQEIKSIDERYWQFAVPVEDGE